MYIVLVISWLSLLPEGSGVAPLREQWQLGVRALRAGALEAAVQAFAEFEHWYGEEAQVRTPEFREVYLRYRGLAYLGSGRTAAGIGELEEWLRLYAEHPHYRAYIRYHVAGGHAALGEMSRAVEHWQRFLADHSELPESQLVRWHWAEAALAEGDNTTAAGQLGAILENPELASGARVLAACALALVQLAMGEVEAATATLSQAVDAGEGQLALVWAGAVAPAMVERHLQMGNYATAYRVQSWFCWESERAQALQQQRQRLRAARGNAWQRAGVREQIWSRHWQRQLDRMEGSGAAAQAADEDEVRALYSLRLEALIRHGRHAEAALLAELLADDRAGLPHSVRVVAYKGGIRALTADGRTAQSRALAEQFRDAYPEDPALPEILFLSAQASAAEGELSAAVELLQWLRDKFPQHPGAAQWNLQLGAWKRESGDPGAALACYAELLATGPAHWHAFILWQCGLCHRDLKSAVAAQQSLTAAMEHPHASFEVREECWVELLKLHLQNAEFAAFIQLEGRMRAQFAGGRHSDTVRFLYALLYERQGDLEQALLLLAELDAPSSPFRARARESISSLLWKLQASARIAQQAIDWLTTDLRIGGPVDSRALLDLVALARAPDRQHAAGAAIPQHLSDSLLAAFCDPSMDMPRNIYLRWMVQQWPQLPVAVTEDLPFGHWQLQMAERMLAARVWSPYAALQLHRAETLQAAGRSDSADTAVLELLLACGEQQLDSEASHALAMVALRYDFPAAPARARRCLAAHPAAPMRPSLLQAMAERYARDGNWQDAYWHLQEILQRWPDAENWPAAALQLARWQLHRDPPASAAQTLNQLLERSAVAPEMIAEALLLRGKAHLLAAEPTAAHSLFDRLELLFPAYADRLAAVRQSCNPDNPQP